MLRLIKPLAHEIAAQICQVAQIRRSNPSAASKDTVPTYAAAVTATYNNNKGRLRDFVVLQFSAPACSRLLRALFLLTYVLFCSNTVGRVWACASEACLDQELLLAPRVL